MRTQFGRLIAAALALLAIAGGVHAQNVSTSAIGGTPCTTTALSLQYNNGGAFGCISGATTDGTAVTLTANTLVNTGISSNTADAPLTIISNSVGQGYVVSTSALLRIVGPNSGNTIAYLISKSTPQLTGERYGTGTGYTNAVATGVPALRFQGSTYDGAALSAIGRIDIQTTETQAPGAHGSSIVLSATSIGSTTVATAATFTPTLATFPGGLTVATTVNGNTFTTGTGTLTLGSVTLNAGAGGTLGSNAFTNTAYLPLAGGTLTGLETINTNVTAAPSPITGAGLLVNAADAVTARIQAMSYGAISAFTTARANGTAASPTGLVNADQIGGVNGYGWTSAAALAGPAYSYRGYATETWSATANGTKACIATTANTTTTLTDKFCVDQDGSATHTSAGSSALAVGLNGATNPAFKVDASTASQAAGLSVTGAVTGGTVAITAIDSGSNTNLTINAKGSGTIGIGSVSTGAVTITPTLTLGSTLIFGGVVFTNTTGTAGALVSSVSPTITGTGTISAATLSASTQFSGPLYRGGTATSTALVIESTSAAGTTDSITFKTGSQVTALTISTAQLATFTGQVAITNMTQTSAAQSGTVCWASGGLTYDATLGCLASLPELKDLHGQISVSLASIGAIKPYWFSWKPSTPEWKGGDHAVQPGFNAREIAAIPGIGDRLTAKGPDGKLRGVRYAEMTAYLQAEIIALKAANDNLSARLAKVERGR